MLRSLLSIACLSCLYLPAYSQARDTAFLAVAIANTVDLHRQNLAAQSRLFNGSKYRPPRQTFDEHPYFASEDWLTGSVFYDGQLFENVSLMYDVMNDVVITEHFPSGHAIRLVEEKLDYFKIGEHFFEKIGNAGVSNSLPETGFYEILYNGETRLIAERRKFLDEEIELTEVIISYDVKDRYFLLRNGVYFPVKTKASVLKLMGNRKQELKKYLRDHDLSFGTDRELALKKMAERYDELR